MTPVHVSLRAVAFTAEESGEPGRNSQGWARFSALLLQEWVGFANTKLLLEKCSISQGFT